MPPYLVSARPVNVQRGDDVILFLRENGKSFTRTVKLPHIMPSIRMDKRVAEAKLAELRARHPSIAFELKECGKKKAAIWAKGPKEMKEQLGSYKYMVSRIGATQLLRWRAEPFSFVRFDGDNVIFLPRDSIDDLLVEKAAALDLEVRDWRGKGARAGTIYQASFVTKSNFGNYVISTPEADSGIMLAKLAGSGISAQLVPCTDEAGLIAKLNGLFRDYDPLFVYGSNVGTYDLLKLKETGGFCPGVLGGAPRLEANCGFFKRVGIEGRCVIDTASWSANWGWTPNNKLVTVGSYLLGKEVKKDLSYDQIDEMLEEEDPADITEIAIYNLKDSIYAYEVGSFILPHVIRSSMFYGASPSTICTTGRKNIAMDLDSKRQMTQMKTVEKGGIDDEFREFDLEASKYVMLKKLDPGCVGAKRGLFRNAHVIYLTPFIHALGRYAAFNKAGAALYKGFMDESADPKTRVLFAEALNGYIEKMIYDLCRMRRIRVADLGPIHSPFDVTDAEMPSDVYFGFKYGIGSQGYHHAGGYRPNNFQTVTNSICDSVDLVVRGLNGLDVINHSDRFLFAKPKHGNALRELTGSGLGVDLGRADVLSATQGRVLYRTADGNILSEERDPTGRKGHKTVLEQEMIPEFGKLVFEHKAKALSYVWETTKCLVEGTMSREKLVFDTTARMDNENFSAASFKQERSKMMVKYGVKKGEKLSYAYAKLANGLPGRDERGKEYSSGYEGDVPARLFLSDELSEEVLVAKGRYLDRMFGKRNGGSRDLSSGTIGDLLVSAFPSRSAEVRDVLNAVAEGDPNVWIAGISHEQDTLF
ncbi:Uncharacterised protein [uncultured archaeon]|nr:Uncharacterised protein [uncultured archaeon]